MHEKPLNLEGGAEEAEPLNKSKVNLVTRTETSEARGKAEITRSFQKPPPKNEIGHQTEA